MQTIQFFPKEFHDVSYGIDKNETNILTPHYPYPDEKLLNQIALDSPQKIIYRSEDSTFNPIIPICGYYLITTRRGLKFAEQDQLIIHIKKNSDEKWLTGIVADQPQNEHPASAPWEEQQEKERQKRIKEAQTYSDEELEEGQAFGEAININALSYVKGVLLESGKYEIYITMSGLESNHVEVEIIIEN